MESHSPQRVDIYELWASPYGHKCFNQFHSPKEGDIYEHWASPYGHKKHTMPQSLSKVYVHITFSTKYRQNLIDKAIEEELFNYLGGTCKALGCHPIRVGGYRNHVHILCTLARTVTQSKLLEEVKKRSSKWIKTKGIQYTNFYWQDGYGIFSVNPAEIDVVKRYIENQEAHHSKRIYKDEFRAFLKKYKVDYDERYVWD